MKNTMDGMNFFVFLATEGNGRYFCKSFFPENKKDYAERQTRWTVLSKKKFLKSVGSEALLYTHPAYNPAEGT